MSGERILPPVDIRTHPGTEFRTILEEVNSLERLGLPSQFEEEAKNQSHGQERFVRCEVTALHGDRFLAMRSGQEGILRSADLAEPSRFTGIVGPSVSLLVEERESRTHDIEGRKQRETSRIYAVTVYRSNMIVFSQFRRIRNYIFDELIDIERVDIDRILSHEVNPQRVRLGVERLFSEWSTDEKEDI